MSLHVAVIPDGNRRWAKERSLMPWQGHHAATANTRDLIEWSRRSTDISVFTLWCFSTENWKRDPREVHKIMELLEEYLDDERPKLIKNSIRLLQSGRTDRIPSSLKELIKTIAEETQHFTDFTLHLALDYGGKDEIIRAITRLPAGKSITEEVIRQQVDQPDLPDIDLIIRTSGEQRTSNFFMWQAAYAEWVFSPKYYPDFTPHDLALAVELYHERRRRFGQ